MKKMVFAFAVFAMVHCVFSQGKQLDGYDTFKWGATVEEVGKKYALEDIAQKIEFDLAKGEEIYANYGNPLRRFRFFNGKLYETMVLYYDIDDNQAIAVMSKLGEKYGEYDGYKQKGENSAVVTWHYSKNLTVMAALEEDYSGCSLSVVYISPEIDKHVREKLQKKYREDMEL